MKITRSKRFHARNTDPNIVSGTCLSCETAGCAHKGKRKKRGQKEAAWQALFPNWKIASSARAVARRVEKQQGGGGSGRCQGQIQLLTPENTKTVITETRETADSGPISLSTLLLSPSPRVFFFRAILLHPDRSVSRIRRSSTISRVFRVSSPHFFPELSSAWKEKKKKNIDQGNWSGGGYFGSTLAEVNGFAL